MRFKFKIDESLQITTLLLAFVLVAPGIAWAAESAETAVRINYGAAIGSMLDGAGNLLYVTLAGAVATFSPGVWAFMRITRLNQLLEGALNKAVEEFRHDITTYTITVDLRNKVVADAVRYALDHGAKSVVAWAGGEKGIREKLQSRFQDAVTKWLAARKA